MKLDFEALLDATPVAIVIHQGGKVLYSNATAKEFATGLWPDSDTDNFDLYERLPEGELERVKRAYHELEENPGIRVNLPRTGTTSDGQMFPLSMSIRPVEWKGERAWELAFYIVGAGKDLGEEIVSTNALPGVDYRHHILEQLTPRERDIAYLVAQGTPTSEIAQQLGITEATVRSHLKAVFRKTVTHSRSELTHLLHGVF